MCIDEYQDVDEQQVRLIRQIVPPDGNICAIGDPDQAIYGFRGADRRFFSEFTEHYPGSRTVRLNRNYRSDRNIVTLSSQVIAPAASAGPSVPVLDDAPNRVTLHEAPSEKAEAEFVVQSLEEILGGHSFFSIDSGRSAEVQGQDFSFSDFALLYRTEAQAPALTEALQRSGMPFQQRSHDPLLSHPGVAALVDTLRRSPGTGTVRQRLEAACKGDEPPGADKREARELLKPLADTCGEDLERFLSELALGTQVDTWDPRADRISLLTLHAAKGLEFPVVFIVGCEDGLLPLTWGKPDRRTSPRSAACSTSASPAPGPSSTSAAPANGAGGARSGRCPLHPTSPTSSNGSWSKAAHAPPERGPGSRTTSWICSRNRPGFPVGRISEA